MSTSQCLLVESLDMGLSCGLSCRNPRHWPVLSNPSTAYNKRINDWQRLLQLGAPADSDTQDKCRAHAGSREWLSRVIVFECHSWGGLSWGVLGPHIWSFQVHSSKLSRLTITPQDCRWRWRWATCPATSNMSCYMHLDLEWRIRKRIYLASLHVSSRYMKETLSCETR